MRTRYLRTRCQLRRVSGFSSLAAQRGRVDEHFFSPPLFVDHIPRPSRRGYPWSHLYGSLPSPPPWSSCAHVISSACARVCARVTECVCACVCAAEPRGCGTALASKAHSFRGSAAPGDAVGVKKLGEMLHDVLHAHQIYLRWLTVSQCTSQSARFGR